MDGGRQVEATHGGTQPGGGGRLAPVDGLRGLAAMMVVIGHIHLAAGSAALGGLNVVLGQLGSGVDLFFVLSGFCLFYPLTKPGAAFSARDFFRRRARRILPPYYAAMGVLLLLPPLLGPLAARVGVIDVPAASISWQQIWTHLLLVHTLFPGTFFGIDGPFWSLGVELQFYLAFPLAVWLTRRYGWRGLLVMGWATIVYQGAVSLVVHAQLPPSALTTGNATVDVKALFFLGRWLEFALGMAVAMLVRGRHIAAIGAGREALVLAGCAGAWAAATGFLRAAPDHWLLPIANPAYGAAFAALLLLACTPGSRTGRLLSGAVAVWTGTISYSLYLIHLPLLLAIGPTIIGWGWGDAATLLAETLIGLPLVLGCAAAFYWVFERPFLAVREGSTAALFRLPRMLLGFG